MNDSAARAGGYITEIPYVVRYHRHLNPSVLRLALASRGIAWGNARGRYDYLELGAGFGLPALIHAAGNPDLTVTAVDFNPEHVETARGIAKTAGLTNVTFIEGAFAELENHGMGQFDIIALHGVWSWVNDENRRHILRFAAAHLRPGGVFYVSYNAMPGTGSALPLRRMMRFGFDRAQGSVEAKVDAGVAFAEMLRKGGAAFFPFNPRAVQMLDGLKTQSRNAIAHEFFNDSWRAFYQDEVAGEMAGIGLGYGASASLLDNLDHLNYTPEARETLLTRPEGLETIKDFLANREFRRDIFVKAPAAMADAAELVAAIPFAATGDPDQLDAISGQTVLGKVLPRPEIAKPVLTVLREGPASALDLVRHPACAGLTAPAMADTLYVLAALSAVEPALPQEELAARKAVTDRLNGVMWQAAVNVDVIHSAVSPITGGGVPIDRIEQLFMLARLQGEPTEAFLTRVFGGNVQGDIAGNLAKFETTRLPALQRLGIG